MGSHRLSLLVVVFAAITLVLTGCVTKTADSDGCGDACACACGDGCGDGTIEAVEDEQKLRTQFSDVMYRRLYAQAKAHRKGLRLEEALASVRHALTFNPTSEAAQNLQSEIQRLMGDRAGEVATVLDDHWEAAKAKQTEQNVAVQRWLAKADTAMTAQDWETARRAYENAAFSSARLAASQSCAVIAESALASQR